MTLIIYASAKTGKLIMSDGSDDADVVEAARAQAQVIANTCKEAIRYTVYANIEAYESGIMLMTGVKQAQGQ